MVDEVPARDGSRIGNAGRMLFVKSGFARAGSIAGNMLLAFSIDGQ